MSDVSDGNKICGDVVKDEKEDLALRVFKMQYAVMTDYMLLLL